jgi:uncharacterized protein YcbK (DUF882 family)
MMYKSKYFKLKELVCRHVYEKFGEKAWSLLDPRLLQTLDIIKEALDKPIYINNWSVQGALSQRGLRCILCKLVKDAFVKNTLYMSAHMEGQAVDFDVMGMTAEEVRKWIIEHQDILPYSIRLEDGVSWVHLDVRGEDDVKVYLFKAA